MTSTLRSSPAPAAGDGCARRAAVLPGELLDRFKFEDISNYVIENGKPAKVEPVVLGLTKAALNTESFLAMASFQRPARVDRGCYSWPA